MTRYPISKGQALALFFGRKNLLPLPAEGKRQPTDRTGEYFVGPTKDREFYTEYRPKGGK
jgi:hypothetical protein